MKFDIQPADPSVLILEFDGSIDAESVEKYMLEFDNWTQAIDPSIKRVHLDLTKTVHIDPNGYAFFKKIKEVVKSKDCKFDVLGAPAEFSQVMKNRTLTLERRENKRKFERTPIKDMFSLYLLLPRQSQRKVAIKDISESGIKFFVKDSSKFEKKRRLNAHLHVNDRLYLLIELSVKRLDEEGVAAEFKGQSEKGVEALYSLINFLRVAMDD